MKKTKQTVQAGPQMCEPTRSRRIAKYAQSRVSKHVADLQWQIRFTQMKLNQWQEQENCRWMNLVQLQEHAKRQLSTFQR